MHGTGRRRKARARLGKSVRNYSFEAVRRPGLWFLDALRAMPVVETRVIPSLLKEELDEMPAAPHAEAMRREIEPLTKTTAPIVIGPWVGEVGYELLYWIPFLNWALKAFGLEQRRLIVVSRGGARHWYRHLTSEYVDVFDLFTLDEYREANEAAVGQGRPSEAVPRRADGPRTSSSARSRSSDSSTSSCCIRR